MICTGGTSRSRGEGAAVFQEPREKQSAKRAGSPSKEKVGLLRCRRWEGVKLGSASKNTSVGCDSMETARSQVESSAVLGSGEKSSVESWAEASTGKRGADESLTWGSTREVTAAAEDGLVTGKVFC